MLVEVFVQSEDQSIVDSDEARKLIEALDLKGQRELFHPSGERRPFGVMSTEELAVYSTLFPAKLTVEDYSRCAIPVRALECYRDHKKHLEKVEVWCPHSLQNVDALLVGISPGPTQWTKLYYLMARWGTAPMDYATQRDKVATIWLDKQRRHGAEVLMRVEAAAKMWKAMTKDDMLVHMQEHTTYPTPYFSER